MKQEEYLLLGKVIKTHGYQGGIQIILHPGSLGLATEILNMEVIFLKLDGILVPFFIEIAQTVSEEMILIDLQTVDTKEKAIELIGNEVYLKTSHKTAPTTIPEFQKYLGFLLRDSDGLELGKISELQDLNGNLVFVVDHKEQTIMIPAHMDLVIEVNQPKKEIRVEIPDGLLET